MKRVGLAPLAKWIAASMSVLISAAALAQPRAATHSPDSPPPIIDPLPGPFIVGFDVEGTLNETAEGIIANAARSWMVDGLDSYSICYQPGADERAQQSGFTALQNVARRLKAHGAATVVMVSSQCPAGWSVQNAPRPYVYIMGAVRL